MKKVMLSTAIALCSLSALACTVTVGEKFDDDDDSDFVDDADDFVDDADDFVDDADEDATDVDTDSDETDESSSETTGSSTTPSASDDAGTSPQPDASDDTTTANVDPTTTSDSTSTNPVNPVNPEPDQCEPPGDAYSCAECLMYFCTLEWAYCCGDSNCVATWNEITACVANPMSEEPIDDVDRCAAEASPTGDQLDLSAEVQAVMDCVATEYMGDPDDLHGHQPGEGTCTLYCYNAEAIHPPIEE